MTRFGPVAKKRTLLAASFIASTMWPLAISFAQSAEPVPQQPKADVGSAPAMQDSEAAPGAPPASPEPKAEPVPVPVPLPADRPAPQPIQPSQPVVAITDQVLLLSTFVREAGRAALDGIGSANDVNASVRKAGELLRDPMASSAAAAAAFGASREPAFKSGVEYAVELLGKETVLTRLKESPDFIARIQGHRAAEEAAGTSVQGMVNRVERAAKTLEEAAYSLQKERWAVVRTPSAGVLAEFTAGSEIPLQYSVLNRGELVQDETTLKVRKEVLVSAAYLVLGEEEAAARHLVRVSDQSCIRRAKLNTRQCLAVSGYPYESVFCLSKHVYKDAAECMANSVK